MYWTALKKPPVAKATGITIQKNDIRTFKSDNAKGGTGDITRDKCIELIYDGLACDATARKFFSSSLTAGFDNLASPQPLITYSPKLVG